MSLISVRVERKWTEAQDIVGLTLSATDGGALPAYEPGAHVDVHLPGGLVRSYSLCHRFDGGTSYHLAVLRDVNSRGGSEAVHDALAQGDVVQINAPRNLFGLVPTTGRSLLVAGGIGITPMLCMAEQLAHQQADFALHYATRSATRTAFAAHLSQVAWAHRVVMHHDDGPADQQLNLQALLSARQSDDHLYVCGPRGLIDAVQATARQCGWPESHVHQESFGAATTVEGDAPFEVQVASTGQVVVVPAGQTIVQALAAQGVVLSTACEQGVCGTCLTGVLSGTPLHRDQYLTPEEQQANDQLLACCARAVSPRLVLDI